MRSTKTNSTAPTSRSNPVPPTSLELRNEICGKGLLKGDACKLPDFPAWTREPPSLDVTVQQIDERSQWLSAASDPFTSFGCEAGRAATKDDLFCSVE